MVNMKGFMLRWFSGFRFSKDPGTLIDAAAVAQTSREKTFGHEDIHQMDKRYHELIDDDSPALETHRSPLGTPSEWFSAKGKEAMEHRNDQEESIEIIPPMTDARRAEINENLALYQEDFSSLRAIGEPMRQLFDLLMKNEDMLEEYGQVAEGDSISAILKKLKEIQRDINELIQIRFRSWASLRGRVLAPAYKKEIDLPGRKTKNDPNDVLYSKGKAQHHPSSEANTSEVEVQEVPQPQLNDDTLGIIYKKAVGSRVQDLNKLLHRVKFPHHALPNWGDREKIRMIKLCFEMCIFQAVGFMYQAKLIEEGNFKSFFSTVGTLDLIGKHLVDLYPVLKYGLYHPTGFIPDMEFLSNHWQTKHVHEILRGFDMEQQAHVIGKALLYQGKLLTRATIADSMVDFGDTSYGSSSKINRKFLKVFFSDLEKFNPIESSTEIVSSTTQALLVNEGVKEIIEFFQAPIFYETFNENNYTTKFSEFILSYHILNFVKGYYSQHLGSFFEDEILNRQLELVQEGIKMHQLIKQIGTYSSITSSSENKFQTISPEFARIEKGRCMEEYMIISDRYRRLVDEFSRASTGDYKAWSWFKGTTVSRDILRHFNRVSESLVKALKDEKERRRKFFKLNLIFKKHYDLDNFKDSTLLRIIDSDDLCI